MRYYVQDPLDRLELLRQLSFGETVAEAEIDHLHRYFARTALWTDLQDGRFDITLGPKGSGKSALYLLLARESASAEEAGRYIIKGENLHDTPVFSQLAENPLPNETSYDGLWKLYILTLAIGHLHAKKVQLPSLKTTREHLVEAGLLRAKGPLSIRRALSSIRTYLSRLIPQAIEGGIQLDPITLMPSGVKGRIILAEPSDEQRDLGIVSVDELMRALAVDLEGAGLCTWILLDRLDEAFVTNRSPESRRREELAITALLREYTRLISVSSIGLKIFVRSDIWDVVLRNGLPGADHITRKRYITWDKRALLHLAAKRIVENRVLLSRLNMEKTSVLSSDERQSSLFHSVFPAHIDSSSLTQTTFDWILAHIRDGRGYMAPRDLVGIMNEARVAEIHSLEIGEDRLPEDLQALISPVSIREAMALVSEQHLIFTLINEYPETRGWIESLRDGNAILAHADFTQVWGVEMDEVEKRVRLLAEIGLLQTETLSTSGEPVYSVPLLYRPALGMAW